MEVTKIGDIIETVKIITYGSYAGRRLEVELLTEEACQEADSLIQKGTWRTKDADRSEG